MKKDIKTILLSLARASGDLSQDDVSALLIKKLEEFMPARVDCLGNVIGEKKGSAPAFLLDAHFDSIGLIVTKIENGGFLRVAGFGGVDLRTLAAHDVVVHGKENIYGVVTSTPPHLALSEGKSAAGFDEIMVDTGLELEKLCQTVSLGDRITLKTPYREMKNNAVSGAYFDNKAGVCTILRCLEILKENNAKNAITVLFSNQEETGKAGAAVGGFNLPCDKCISVDVSFVKTNATPAGITAELSKGVMIGFSPILNYEMSCDLQKTAQDNKILHQLEIMADATGTNADALAISAGGKKTALLSIPLKNMHTGVEMLCLDDIESAARLMAEYILASGGADND